VLIPDVIGRLSDFDVRAEPKQPAGDGLSKGFVGLRPKEIAKRTGIVTLPFETLEEGNYRGIALAYAIRHRDCDAFRQVRT